jgi:hypothetical protein
LGFRAVLRPRRPDFVAGVFWSVLDMPWISWSNIKLKAQPPPRLRWNRVSLLFVARR